MTVLRRSGGAILTALLASAVLMAPAAAASTRPGKTIDVFPGKHALAKALAKAQSGDTLDVHTGTYKDAVVVTTPSIVIESAGDGPVTIDGRCAAESTIAVRAPDVSLFGDFTGGFTVQGGQFYEVDFQHVQAGAAAGMTVVDTCGAAEYGINLFDTGALFVHANVASGFDDAGIYVGGITDTGGSELTVSFNEVFGSNRGIIVEDSFGVDMVVESNNVHDNETSGIHLTNSDGIVVRKNTARSNGTYGIDLDATSDNNQVIKNTAKGNQFDLANLGGSGNCFRHNKYKTSQGDISC
jgi:parallel beta-helix repeat protein